MIRTFTAITAACAGMMLSGISLASPIVTANSTFNGGIFGNSSGLSQGTFTFDGAAETVTNGARTFTVDESEQDLGGGLHRISFEFTSNADLFPSSPENGFVNIGFPSNPLDLLSSVDLLDAVLRMYDASGALVDGPGTFSNPAVQAWDGYWLSPNTFGGFLNVGGRDIRRIELDLNVAAIPEPQSLVLVALGLLAAAAVRRRVC